MKPIKGTRKFNGKLYALTDIATSKDEMEKMVAGYDMQGYNVREVRVGKKEVYRIYTRKEKR